MTLMFVFLP